MKKWSIVIVLILFISLIGRIYVNGLFRESIVPVVIKDVSVCIELVEERCLEKVNTVSQDTQDIYLDVEYAGEGIGSVTWYYTLNNNTEVIAESVATQLDTHHTFSLEKNLDKGWLIGKYGAVVMLNSGSVQNYYFEVR